LRFSLDTVDTIWYHSRYYFLIKDKGAIMDEIEAFLDKVESMDSYWQKFEWIDLREDNPELYDRVIEYKRDRGDSDM
jgi:hypothetical protein